MTRLDPKVVVSENVRCQSARDGSAVRLIVVHSTESDNVLRSFSDLQAVANWFDDPSNPGSSSHVITDSDGHSARCVPDDKKAWSCAGFNSPSLNIEQIGRASQGHWAEEEILEAARWVARWSRKHHIPIQPARVSGTRVIEAGVIRHSQLGSYGGGHSDPGADYPFGALLHEAKHFKKLLQERDRERG